MGKRYKEKQLAAQAGRRRAVLQIDRVSRREVNEVPVRAISTKREVNPNSVTGIGLLGAYGEDSSDEEDEVEPQCGAGAAVDSSVPENNERQPGYEMDAKLADFFKEIESIDPDTAPSSTEGQTMGSAKAFPGDITSTTELDAREMQSFAETNGGDAEQQSEIPYPWQMCLDESTNCYYYWNTETNEVRWEPPEAMAGGDGVMEYGEDNDVMGDDGECYGPSLPDSRDADMEDNQPAIGPSLPPNVTETEEVPDSQAGEDEIAVSSGPPLVEYQDTEDNTYPATPPDSQCGGDIDNFEVVDTWGGDELVDEAIDGRAMEESDTREEPQQVKDTSCKKPSLDTEQDSDDEFAAMLLEDTYHKGQKDSVKEETETAPLEQENADDVNSDDAEDSQATPLLPPMVFEHLKASSSTVDKTSSSDTKAEEKIELSVAEKESEEKEEKFRQEILGLSATITNKLDFLEISRKGIANLQILRIEMETRIRDWRDGGLTSSHLVRKLEEAKLHFQQYEESAAPPGWTCKWHRTHKRYFYTNNADGESQWDYPLVGNSETKEEMPQATPKTTPSSSIVTDVTVTPTPSTTTPVATVAMTTAGAAATTSVVRTVSLPAWGNTAQTVYPSIPSASLPVHGTIQAPVIDYTMQSGLPMVSTVPAAAMYHNPPVPGTDSSVEAVPFSLKKIAEEPPPPPPGTDEPPPLPSGDVPPPPPPEPTDDKPPPPPGEEPTMTTFSTTGSSVVQTSSGIVSSSTTISAPQSLFPLRNLIDYSDLDRAVTTSPLAYTGLSGELVSSIQSSGIEQVSSGQGSGTSSPVPTNALASTKTKTKRKKATKLGSTLSSKARKVSSLVQKWQSIKVEEPEIESEEEEEIDPEVVSQKQIQQWKLEHLTSGQAAYNPNFEEIKGDWRERVLKKKNKAGAGD